MNKILSLLHRIYRLRWRCNPPLTLGTKIILSKGTNDVLLVKHSYRQGWQLPGGAVKRKERPEDAICREVMEELGIEVSSPKFLGFYTHNTGYWWDYIVLFESALPNSTLSFNTNWEIADYQFFSMDDLPESIAKGCKTILRQHRDRDKHCHPCLGVWGEE